MDNNNNKRVKMEDNNNNNVVNDSNNSNNNNNNNNANAREEEEKNKQVATYLAPTHLVMLFLAAEDHKHRLKASSCEDIVKIRAKVAERNRINDILEDAFYDDLKAMMDYGIAVGEYGGYAKAAEENDDDDEDDEEEEEEEEEEDDDEDGERYNMDVDSDYGGEGEYKEDAAEWSGEKELALTEEESLILIDIRLKYITAIDKKKSEREKARSLCINGSSVFVGGANMAFVGSQMFSNRKIFVVDTYNLKLWRGPTFPVHIYRCRAVHIGNGDFFVCGGYVRNVGDKKGQYSNRCWIVNAMSGHIVECPPMKYARSSHELVYVEKRKTVVVIGGSCDEDTDVAECEFFDLNGRKWSNWYATLKFPRFAFSATLIPNSGAIVVLGGYSSALRRECTHAEVISVKMRVVTAFPVSLRLHEHSAILLNPAEILLTGGQYPTGADTICNLKTWEFKRQTIGRDYEDRVVGFGPWGCRGPVAIKHKSLVTLGHPNKQLVHLHVFRNIHLAAMSTF